MSGGKGADRRGLSPRPPRARRTPRENDPPWVLQLIRVSGAPAWISLAQVGGGAQWRWQLGSQPRLSSSDRPTPENALQSWIDRHLEALHVDSQQALRNLQGQWRTQGLPHPPPPARVTRCLDDGQTTHLISVCLNMLLYIYT